MIKQHVKKIKRRHVREVLVYGAVGISALIIQDLIYWIAHRYFGVFPSVAMVLGSIGGMFVAYVGHIKYTFKKQIELKFKWIRYSPCQVSKCIIKCENLLIGLKLQYK